MVGQDRPFHIGAVLADHHERAQEDRFQGHDHREQPVREHILERLDLEPQDEPGPGEFVCLDTFYVGQLKGVGKVWQIIACDAFGSYGGAGLLPAFTAAAVATFLRTVLVPHYRRAGWPVQRVLIDGGPEFKDAFDDACRALGVRHTRTKPRHAWTNGFVERPQGTILQEHWCVVFRRRYFTSRAALQRSLDGLLRFYNYDRPHQGYRLRGQAPASLFWGAVRA